jgi:hypothetical protein
MAHAFQHSNVRLCNGSLRRLAAVHEQFFNKSEIRKEVEQPEEMRGRDTKACYRYPDRL